MSLKTFDLNQKENPWQYDFFFSKNDINGYTGGYGNGKTAVMCIRAINVASSYEGARCLVGRATRPKLEDSTKKELLKWLPEDWVARWPSERRNDIVLKATGSSIEFRHIRREGKGKNEDQSNLLSATYDYIGVDQFDDPEFSYKDFEDLAGRLRGTAKYIGSDKSMPSVGPQWFDFTANPTRNWLYREIVAPFFLYQDKGLINSKLLYDRERKKPLVSIFNAPTQANKRNTGEKYASRLQMIMRGSQAKRFIEGKWDAYDGLVYPDYSDSVHMVYSDQMQAHIAQSIINGEVGILEAYDFGQASPSCYLLAFVDRQYNVLVCDGFYEPMKTIQWQAAKIKEIRSKWKVIPTEPIYADPDIFRSKSASKDNVGQSVAALFDDEGIEMQRGSNNVAAGIEKVSSYLAVDAGHMHPITGNIGAPRFFVSSDLEFVSNEFADYYWNRNTTGQNVDKPLDRNDHSMDAIKYMFTNQANVIGMIAAERSSKLSSRLLMWAERADDNTQELAPRHRYG